MRQARSSASREHDDSSEILSDDGLNEQTQITDHSSVQGQQTVHYPWKFVSAQLKNSKNEEIFFPVNDDKDQNWARRLEWAADEHRDLADADMDRLQTDFKQVLRQSKRFIFGSTISIGLRRSRNCLRKRTGA